MLQLEHLSHHRCHHRHHNDSAEHEYSLTDRRQKARTVEPFQLQAIDIQLQTKTVIRLETMMTILNDEYSGSDVNLWASDEPDSSFTSSQSISDDAGADLPKSHFYSKKELNDPSFSNSKLFPLLCQGVGIERPSRIQSMAWPILLEGKHAIVADQTGSGKTLAYLIPLVQRALEGIARDSARTNGAPRLLVLSPTAELADQI